jgi:hypothetical protein
MKPASILPSAIVLAATSRFGQSLTRIDPSTCPVGLQVGRSSSLFAYETAKAVPREIVNAEITVHGLRRKLRVVDYRTLPMPLTFGRRLTSLRRASERSGLQ